MLYIWPPRRKPDVSTGNLCATTLAENEAEFAPFCEFSDNVSSFEGYVEQVRSSAEWGGHLELRILSKALNRPIEVYSIQSGKSPLRIAEEGIDNDGAEPIRLSYHLNYYALGEHYNQVCPKWTHMICIVSYHTIPYGNQDVSIKGIAKYLHTPL